jgi:Xaa-Pro aminopeptidase
MDYSTRQHQLLASIKGHTDIFLTNDLPSIRYLTGFSGSSAWLVAGHGHCVLVTDFRYQEQCKHEVTASRTIIITKSFHDDPDVTVLLSRANTIGFAPEKLSYDQYQELKRRFVRKTWVPLKSVVRKLRLIKDPSEIKLIRKAMAITEAVFSEVLPLVKPGVREADIAAEIDYRMRKHGSPQPAFPTIVAAGWRSALPHAAPGVQKLKKGDFVVMDFGATWQGYCGDFTRTVCVGKASKKQKAIYTTVLEAQIAALAAVRPSIAGREVDGIARAVIEKAGYGRYFGHGLGHGIGLEVHEDPRLSKLSSDTLLAGMVHSVEPGIYLPSPGGVRIEDVVVVTKKGYKNLTTTSKELLEI